MKVAASVVLLGAASAAYFQQQVQHVLSDSHVATNPLVEQVTSDQAWEDLEELLRKLPSQSSHILEQLKSHVPASEISKAISAMFKPPKKHTRRPNSSWDHIVEGSSVATLSNDKSNEDLNDYSLRVKAVDPSKLGIDTVKQYSGYLDDQANDKHLFYWFFESRNDPKNDPVVLWLNGGPGCSSLTGLFMELGPASINKKLEVVNNPYSWNSNASVIFLDQPVNVGFSYSGGSVSDTVAASKDVYALLSLFFHQYPEYAKQDFHIAGESYAGHYIPVFTTEILSHKNRNINLKSVLIGNGLTDGLTQYEYYRPMACGQGGYPAVLEENECNSMAKALPLCQSLIKGCYDSGSALSCVGASVYCNYAIIGPYQRTEQNVYDIRGKCEDTSNLCYSALGWISEYLNQQKVREALGVEVEGYESCAMDMNRNFLMQGDWMQPFHLHVPKILDEIPVLIYAGDADFICNWLGNRAWTDALEWSGQESFNKAETEGLVLGGRRSSSSDDEYGTYKSSGNFTFLRIYQAGHMVPMDQPKNSLDFFNRWINGEWFSS